MKNLPVIIQDNLDALSEITNDAIVVHKDGKFVYLNNRAIKIIEANDIGDLLGKSILSIMHPDYIQPAIERLNKLEKGLTVPPELQKVITLKGNELTLEISTTPILFEDIPSYLLYARDLSEFIEKNKELDDHKNRLNAIILSIPDLIFIINRDLVIKDVFENNVGLFHPKDQIINKKIIDVLSPMIYLLSKKSIDEVFKTGVQQVIHYDAEIGNEIHYFESRITKKDDSEVLSIIRDISKESKLIAELQYNEKFQKLLTDLASDYLNTNINNFDTIIEKSLKKVGKFLELDDLIYFEYELNKHLIKPVYKWGINEKVDLDIAYSQIPTEFFSNLITSHFRGLHYIVEDLEHSKININIRHFFDKLSINSHLSLPIFKDLECIGFIGLEKRYQKRVYNENELKLLNIFAGLLGNLFSRLSNLKLLEDKNIELEKIRLKNNKLIKDLRNEISDRQRIEEELSISKKQLEATVQFSPIISVQWYNRKGQIVFWNNASKINFGFSEDEVLGKTLEDIIYNSDEQKEFLRIFDEIEKTGKSYGPYESQIKRKDGTVGWIMSSTFMIPGKNLEKLFVCMDVDISEQKNLHRQLNDVILEKDKFLSIIAHDLKTPFTGFLGMTQILANEFDELSPIEIQEISANLFESAENLYKLLENLLEWSRIQRGMVSINKENINLFNLVKNNINLIKLKVEHKGVQIQNNVDMNLSIYADMNMINAILRNLISNAVKFTKNGGTIKISAFEDEQSNIICVEDSGIGIPDNMIQSLFSVSCKVSRTGTDGEPSTGLGLILCKEYVDKHRGKIWINSQENKGSKFCFSIPKNDHQNGYIK